MGNKEHTQHSTTALATRMGAFMELLDVSVDDKMYIEKANAPAGRHARTIRMSTLAIGLAVLSGIAKNVLTITGDDNTKVFTLAHGSTSGKDVLHQAFRDFGDGKSVAITTTRPNDTELVFTFSIAPAIGENYKIVII